MSLRIAHFSDIHLTVSPLRLSKRDWIGKSSAGWLNAKMGRGRHFLDASNIAGVMATDIKARHFDHVIFSGDATTIGLTMEFEEVRRVLQPDDGWPPRLAVPGNHDYYTYRAVRRGEFERVFASWQHGDRIDGHLYPFVQRVGPLWLVAVNSAQANLFVWDSRGRVGRHQRRVGGLRHIGVLPGDKHTAGWVGRRRFDSDGTMGAGCSRRERCRVRTRRLD